MANPKQLNAPYDHPNFLVVRQAHFSGDISAPSANTAYVGSTLRTYTKSMVLGVSIVLGSGGSAAGTNSIDVCRFLAGTESLMQTKTFAVEAGASALNDVVDISLTSGFTLASVGDYAVIEGGAASNDKMAVLKDVIWRYKILPSELEGGSSAVGQ